MGRRAVLYEQLAAVADDQVLQADVAAAARPRVAHHLRPFEARHISLACGGSAGGPRGVRGGSAGVRPEARPCEPLEPLLLRFREK